MGTARRYDLEEIGDVREAVVFRASAEEGELRLVVAVLVDLAVKELGGAGRLRRFEERSPVFAEAYVVRSRCSAIQAASVEGGTR
jgi:hypothetical protein